MKIIKKSKNFGILFGVGALGVGAIVGLSQPASAAPNHGDRDVQEARKDVRDARKDVRDSRSDYRKADTPAERREAAQDLHRDQRDLQRQQRELKEEKREEHRPGYVHRPVVVVPQRPVVVGRPGYTYHPGTNYHPGTSYHPGNGGNQSRSIEGRVTEDLKGNDFNVRTTSGQTLRVLQPSGESGRISRGDTIRAQGYYQGGTFIARSVQILHNR